MSKNIKLGKKANSFYDPTSKLKVLPGQIIVLGNIHKMSARVQKALREGHLQYTNEKAVEVKGEKPKKEVVDNTWIEALELTTEDLMKLKKPQLVEVAKYYETEIEAKKLNALTKEELVEEIFELTMGEDEDEEEDEDDEDSEE